MGDQKRPFRIRECAGESSVQSVPDIATGHIGKSFATRRICIEEQDSIRAGYIEVLGSMTLHPLSLMNLTTTCVYTETSITSDDKRIAIDR
ncbi:hypothetical protein PNOK_0566000 [Pyrrhoderma noxium]|uniref:Uncharacterized protein n=1 Tax=Pyrrhoderma noxium TaxID=2282107 RepID=A0A286UGV4_9AGAM|nr:hypothetical protein PNOK_0566000 [Pyrrhoderma noxium]